MSHDSRDILSSAFSAADALIGGRVVMGTKQQYQGKINAIKQFYTQLNREFTVPVQREDILAFSGWLIDVLLFRPAVQECLGVVLQGAQAHH